ncbi:MAG: hypothetical protein WBX01_09820 [Nitrososphaeraceae archaeon]
MHRNSYISSLTEDQVLSYILKSISEGRIEDEIVERFDGDTKLVKKWVDVLEQTNFVTANYFDELVITPHGKNYLEKYDSHL